MSLDLHFISEIFPTARSLRCFAVRQRQHTYVMVPEFASLDGNWSGTMMATQMAEEANSPCPQPSFSYLKFCQCCARLEVLRGATSRSSRLPEVGGMLGSPGCCL
ncbi:protein of unknown function [Burkholderia multivorans]